MQYNNAFGMHPFEALFAHSFRTRGAIQTSYNFIRSGGSLAPAMERNLGLEEHTAIPAGHLLDDPPFRLFAFDPFLTFREIPFHEHLTSFFINAAIVTHEAKVETPCRSFTEFEYSTLNSWTKARRVIGKAEILPKGDNPRFIVTNLPEDGWSDPIQAARFEPAALYEKFYCARGDVENRIKEQQMDLFADRTSTHWMASNQLRLWFLAFAHRS